jgi:GTP:adenosylcobinamide-phosphate guanylyltransferase
MVMAAGLGARYGGNKQIDKMGPNGEILMEYSIYDALEAGFDKVVFVIKKDMADTFHEMVGRRLAKKVEVCYAFQEYASLPKGFKPPVDRTKPYGTVHAVLCAREVIHEPFAVINADDYYGKGAFAAMQSSLCKMTAESHASMVGYRLRNTVSENGLVTRGVCEVDSLGKLVGVTETYRIALLQNGDIRDTEKEVQLDPECLVSMNFWGFTPWIFGIGESCLDTFLKELEPDETKKEYPLPVMVDSLMRAGLLRVEVLSTEASWFGVTYQEDKAYVTGALRKLHETGAYLDKLF